MISAIGLSDLESVIESEGRGDVEEWAKDYFDLVDPPDRAAEREEVREDAFAEIENARSGDAPIDPLAVINSALAHGQIGRVPWALVERGDGLILAIGDLNIPIDTPAECGAARQLGEDLRDLHNWASYRWPSEEPR